ncbi:MULTISPECIES: hypothetical protein [Variovorax]|jgi:hypothetical protein|uniref:hypothetical protein n=1 Tax=Variovorax TaxID=34072 RepID=UPI0027826FEF|nr:MULTISPECIES: hypothetical protein [Variovorax]MDQ0045137.1 hypothetical protein [Variovorax boronicumulans]MDQ0611661.1 hypothetical protein [Variovorax sp. W1I1]
MKLNYTFSVAPPPFPKEVRIAGVVQHTYNEFMLDLPDHWKTMPGPDANSLNFYSEHVKAAIVLSVQFYEVPGDKRQGLAEVCIKSRIEAHEQQFPGRVEVLQQSIRPHSGGVGLEMSYVAEVANENVFLFVGYVTNRKVLNLLMVCEPGREAAGQLFNATMATFRPKLP